MSDRDAEQPDERQEVPEEEPKEKQAPYHLHINDIRARATESQGQSMSSERYEEIREAREKGENIDYAEGELEEYEELAQEMKELAERVAKAFTPQISSAYKFFSPKNLALQRAMESLAQRQLKADFESVKTRRTLASFPSPQPSLPPVPDCSSSIESVKEAVAAKREQEEADRALLRAQTAALQALAADSERNRIDAEAQAKLEDQRHKRSLFWACWGAVAGAVAALASVVAIIVTINMSS